MTDRSICCGRGYSTQLEKNQHLIVNRGATLDSPKMRMNPIYSGVYMSDLFAVWVPITSHITWLLTGIFLNCKLRILTELTRVLSMSFTASAISSVLHREHS